MHLDRQLLMGGLFIVVFATAVAVMRVESTAKGANDDAKAAKAEAVEPDMHEFMEYVFEPGYKRLRTAMQEAPTNNAGWKPIKGDGLALAEASNLLLFHRPEADKWSKQDDADWDAHAVAVREAGGRLYLAAKNRDFPSASTHYRTMLTKCNACHDQFAGGEHQLSAAP